MKSYEFRFLTLTGSKKVGRSHGNFLRMSMCRNAQKKLVQRKSRRNGNGRKANNQNGLLVPVDIAPITFSHAFPEEGGIFQLSPPKSWQDEKRPVRVSSLLLDHSSTVPCSLRVTFNCHGAPILQTLNFTSSMTSKRIKLRVPKATDYSNENFISVSATGPAFITGLGTFTAKEAGVE